MFMYVQVILFCITNYIYNCNGILIKQELTELESLDSLPKKKVVQVVQEKQPSLVEEKKQKEDEILQKNIEMNKEQQENEIEEKLEIVEGANNKIIDEQIQEKRPTIEYIKEPEKSEIDQIEKESKEIDTIASIVANTSKKNEVDAIQIGTFLVLLSPYFLNPSLLVVLF